MALPATREAIEDEERRLGFALPRRLRERLLAANGGDLWFGEESWTLHSIWDPSSKRSAKRSAGHIERETRALYEALGGLLPPGLAAVAENGDGDSLLVDREAGAFRWWHETGQLEPVGVDWTARRPRRRPRSARPEAVDRVAEGLRQLQTVATALVIEAPGTPIYLQFYRRDVRIIGEAVGEANLPRLFLHHFGDVMVASLGALGWSPPAGADGDAGNWSQVWQASDWDPSSVARLVIATFEDAYGIEPWAVEVTIGTPDA